MVLAAPARSLSLSLCVCVCVRMCVCVCLTLSASLCARGRQEPHEISMLKCYDSTLDGSKSRWSFHTACTCSYWWSVVAGPSAPSLSPSSLSLLPLCVSLCVPLSFSLSLPFSRSLPPCPPPSLYLLHAMCGVNRRVLENHSDWDSHWL